VVEHLTQLLARQLRLMQAAVQVLEESHGRVAAFAERLSGCMNRWLQHPNSSRQPGGSPGMSLPRGTAGHPASLEGNDDAEAQPSV